VSEDRTPLRVPFTQSGMDMLCAMVEGMSRVMDAYAVELEKLQKRLDGKAQGDQ